MRVLFAAATALALAGPVAAGTLQEVTTRGVIVSARGISVHVTYTPDGRFTALKGKVTGDWRIQGDELCTRSNLDRVERCVEYPKGKTSGDSFELSGPGGKAKITIK